MNLVRRNTGSLWDPVGELDRIRREIDSMFDLDSGRSAGAGLFDREFSPALDVVEHENEYVVTVDLPGVSQKDLDVSVANNVLTIKGTKKREQEAKEGTFFRKESWEGSFQRTLSLPQGVDAEKIDAKMTDGVLTLALPKREEVKPRQIAVNVK
jgi:HSP20 family protein